jgi:hypothetical protein
MCENSIGLGTLPFVIDVVAKRLTLSRLRRSSAARVGQRELILRRTKICQWAFGFVSQHTLVQEIFSSNNSFCLRIVSRPYERRSTHSESKRVQVSGPANTFPTSALISCIIWLMTDYRLPNCGPCCIFVHALLNLCTCRERYNHNICARTYKIVVCDITQGHMWFS